MTVFYKTTGAFSHHIVLNLENIEVAVVQNNKSKMEHLFILTLQASVHSVIYLHAYFSFLKNLHLNVHL